MQNRKLPEKEDDAYLLLPAASEPPQPGAKADAWQMMEAINPAYLEFARTERLSYRAFNVLVGSWGSAMFLVMFLPSLFGFDKDAAVSTNLLVRIVADGVVWMFVFVGFFLAYYQLRIPQFRAILSKRLRRFYVWHGKKLGWVTIDYDKAVPAVRRHTGFSPYGSRTAYILDVYELQSTGRLTRKGTGLSEPANHVLPQAELWEFIRVYMDGPATKVPAIEYRVPVGQSHGTHMRIDRGLLPGAVGQDFRLKQGAFWKLYFAMTAMAIYWSMRLLPWLERHAPSPPLPPELAKAMEWSGENPYRMSPPTELEQKAIDGELSYMNRRWFIGMLLSTLFWGGSFLGMALIGWREVLFGWAVTLIPPRVWVERRGVQRGGAK